MDRWSNEAAQRSGATVEPNERHDDAPTAGIHDARRHDVQLLDPDLVRRAVGGTGEPFEPDRTPTSLEEERRRDFLRGYLDAPDGLMRRRIVADDGMLAGLRALASEAPNASVAAVVVEHAALLSRHAAVPLRVPPLLLCGPPGTGKSRWSRRLAATLATTLTVIDGGTVTHDGPISGADPGYRGAGPGRVATALLDGPTASPVMLIDEVDKISSYNLSINPLHSLLPLLEPTTASVFADSYVGLPMRAESVVMVLTANEAKRLPAPLLDRVVRVDVPALGPEETRAAVQRLLAEVLAENGLPLAELDRSALRILQHAGLRQARRALVLALGPALAAGRPAPNADDLGGALALLVRPAASLPRRKRITPPNRLPGLPVGFVRFPD